MHILITSSFTYTYKKLRLREREKNSELKLLRNTYVKAYLDFFYFSKMKHNIRRYDQINRNDVNNVN